MSAWLQFPVRSPSPVKRKTSPPKSSLASKQISLNPTQVDESRFKAWKVTGVVSLRDTGLQVCSRDPILSVLFCFVLVSSFSVSHPDLCDQYMRMYPCANRR